jgi:hypothetical protein
VEDDMDNVVAESPSASSTISIGEPSSETESDSDDEPLAEAEKATAETPAASLAEILANPLPPALSVDSLISETLGNIFQKKVTKDHSIQALLEGREEMRMRDLADELREFAIEIGAIKS